MPTSADTRLMIDGMLIMMALYSLLSYFQQQKPIYWQYALYIACMVLDFRLSDIGYALPDYQPGAYYPETLAESIAYILYIRFAILLIDLSEQAPRTYRLMRSLTGVFVGALILDTLLWLLDVSASVRSAVYMANRLTISAIALYIVPQIFRLRKPVVSYFIAGTLWLLIGSIIALFMNYLPDSWLLQGENALTFPITPLQLGVVGEVLCFTLGMSLRHRENELEKIRYQEELIEQLRENERKQEKLQRIRDDIARDIHDDVGSDLSSISLLSQVAARQVDQQSEQAKATLKQIGQTAKRVVASMREIVWSLNSSQTSLESFTFRLRETALGLFEHQPTQLHLTLPANDPAWVLPPDGRRDLFLMVKEMLHNVIRHAHAHNVYVTVGVEERTLWLTVRDDGDGFSPGPDAPRYGNGLRSLQQRAAALNGQLTVESAPGAGTIVSFRCPLSVEELEVW